MSNQADIIQAMKTKPFKDEYSLLAWLECPESVCEYGDPFQNVCILHYCLKAVIPPATEFQVCSRPIIWTSMIEA